MATAAYDYLRAQYGGDFEVKSGTVNATANNATVSGGNPEAATLTLVNSGPNPCYVWWDNTVAANNGVLLAANGGFLSMNVVEDAVLPCMDWHVVAPTGNTTLNYLLCIRNSKIGSVV